MILEGIREPASRDIGFMPTFKHALDDAQVAQLAAYMRQRFAPDKPARECAPPKPRIEVLPRQKPQSPVTSAQAENIRTGRLGAEPVGWASPAGSSDNQTRFTSEHSMELTAVLTHAEEGGFIALNPETGTTTQGETVEEAVANLRDATTLYLSEFSLPVTGHPFVTMFTVPEPVRA